MSAPIDFYFDFSSPYGYFASEVIDAIGARQNRAVLWHPILLGASFKVTGQQPLPSIPMKGDYAMRDIERSARFMQVPYKHPHPFPLATQHAARAFLWANDRDNAHAREFAQAIYRNYFVDGGNIADLEHVLMLAEKCGFNGHELREAITSSVIKDRLRAEVDLAISRGVFGSPFFIVEGEPFWGVDRLPQLEKWLADGPF
ncbi:2-hydroxychromene-2-carboxylate isomerase [Niveibacterium sp. SC-1]|uniref:2-hydroxychromene-2-carboxylate isomerase n=1 Tax=Niveibacterium sp. SC-1 TaxID=3135646 RepID=UPI00311DD575